jgi:prevent-host-death family protein
MRPTTPIIGTADLQRRAKSILARVRRTRRPHLVCTRNRPEALFLDIATYERMEGELRRLREERRIAERVRRAERDIAAGRVYRGNLATLLRQR